MIPFLDVRYTYETCQQDIQAACLKALESGRYIGGKLVADFEKEFAEYCGTKHAIGVGNGLDALELILRGLNIGPGDEVIVPAHTFIATWLAVSSVGAAIVPVDVDSDTMLLDIDLASAAITSRTKAIMPVHIYGNTGHFGKLLELAKKHGLYLIEDAAQAHGAKTENGSISGSLGDAAGFSFYPGKNLGAFGDGGAVTCNSDSFARTIRMLGNYGSEVKYQHDMKGKNSRLDPLQASILQVKLKKMPEWNLRRAQIADVYMQKLGNIEELILPNIEAGLSPVWHLFVVRHPKRDRLMEALAAEGVGTALHYPIPNHLSNAYKEQFKNQSFPVTEKICQTCLSLPIGPHLTNENIEFIVKAIDKTVKSIR